MSKVVAALATISIVLLVIVIALLNAPQPVSDARVERIAQKRLRRAQWNV